MFGKGFSNPLGDDILSSFITDTAKKSQQPSKNVQLSAEDEKHLLATKKLVQQLTEEEEVNKTKKNPVVKTTSSLAQSNVIKKKPETKPNEDIDDLLDLIEDAKGTKPATKKQPEPIKDTKPTTKPAPAATTKPVGGNAFADELMDDELDLPGYDPTARDTSKTKKPTSTTNISEDLAKKKSALFGLGANSSGSTPISNKAPMLDFSAQNQQQKAQQRPQTAETKATKADEEDDLGDFNIGFSRRKGKPPASAAGKDKERPSSSPGDLKPIQESRVSGLDKSPSTKKSAWETKEVEEDDEDVQSEYLSTVMSRDKRDPKKGGMKFGDSFKGVKSGPTAEVTTPMRSPRSEFTASKEGFYSSKEGFYQNKEVGTYSHLSHVTDDKKDIQRSPVGILGKKELQDYPNQQGGQIKNVSGISNTVVRRDTQETGSRQDNLRGSGLSGEDARTELGGSHGGFVGSSDAALQRYLKDTEEHYRKRAKESEEYYENRFKQLKGAIEEEKRKWEEIHDKEIRLLKKENEELRDNFGKHLDRERERMKEMFNLEMESKEKIHKYELERQRRQMEDENESLRKQLEAQAKLNALADEIKHSSHKLASLSDKIDQGNTGESHSKRGDIREKEKQIEDLERRLRHEMEMVHNERKRFDTLRAELDSRGNDDKENLLKEKQLLKEEYARLNELQESIRRQEIDKLRNLEKEKALYEHERTKLEKEGARIKEEYSRKYHEMEVQIELHEIRKQEFEKVLDKTERDFLQKQQDMEKTMKRLVHLEADLMARVKELEHKELLVNKSAEEVSSRLNILELERITFEKERTQVLKMADQAREDGHVLRKFRQDFEAEQDKNVKLKTELAAFATNLRNEREKINEEKSNIASMQKTLEGMKSEYVRELTLGHTATKPLAPSNRPSIHIRERSQDLSIEKFQNTAPNFYPATTISSPSKGYTGEHERRSSWGQNQFVKLKDLKYGMQTMSGASDVVVEKRVDRFAKTFAGDGSNTDGGAGGWFRSTMYNESSVKVPTGDSFNYKNYMNQLKQFDRATNLNQGYVEMEKEGLIKTKAEIRSPVKYYGSGMKPRPKKYL